MRAIWRLSAPALATASLALPAPQVWADGTDNGVSSTAVTSAGGGRDSLAGPDAVPNQLADDRSEKRNRLDQNILQRWEAAKSDLYDETGLHIGADYNVLFFGATESLGEDVAAGGVARLLVNWDLIGRGTEDTGSLVFKGSHRHKMTKSSVSAFSDEVGYAGLFHLSFSDQGLRVTNLYWRQSFFESRFVGYLGFVDTTDFVDVYAYGSPWTAFSNYVFSTGSAAIGGLPDASFGAMLGGFITDNVYAIGSITDANADPKSVFEGFETFFGDFETFKSFEIGWTTGRDKLFVDNLHVTLWQLDKRDAAGAPGGWGVAASASFAPADPWLVFLRGGWAHDGGSIYEASVTAGFGYEFNSGGDLLAVGVNWGRPNSDTYGANLDDQLTGEIFYRLQLTENVQLTPSVQLLVNPALNTDNDVIGLFGIRGRVSF